MIRRAVLASALLATVVPFAAQHAAAAPQANRQICIIFPQTGPNPPMTDGFCVGTHAVDAAPQ